MNNILAIAMLWLIFKIFRWAIRLDSKPKIYRDAKEKTTTPAIQGWQANNCQVQGMVCNNVPVTPRELIDKFNNEKMKDCTAAKIEETGRIIIPEDHLSFFELDLMDFIEANPGLIEEDLYVYFDTSMRRIVQSILYFGEMDGWLKRIKNGITYELYRV